MPCYGYPTELVRSPPPPPMLIVLTWQVSALLLAWVSVGRDVRGLGVLFRAGVRAGVLQELVHACLLMAGRHSPGV